MKVKKVGFVLSLALMVAVVASVSGSVQQAMATNCVTPCWYHVSSQNVGTIKNTLNGVYEVSSTKVYAVGYYVDSNNHLQALVEKLNLGSGIPPVEEFITDSIGSVPGTGNTLNAISFARNDLTATDMWAVGYYTSTTVTSTLIEKNHSGTWSNVSGANPSLYENILTSIAGSKSNNYYAVGYYKDNTSGVYKTLIERWNGSTWSQVANTPNRGSGNNYLLSVSIASDSAVLAAGYYYDGSTNRPLLLKWDGSNWTDYTSSLPNHSGESKLTGVSMLSANDFALVGTRFASFPNETWAIRHQSSSWYEETFGPYDGVMVAVDYVGNNSIWLVGSVGHGCCDLSYSYYWDGTAWTGKLGDGGGDFLAVSGLSATETWGVGFNGSTMVEHFH